MVNQNPALHTCMLCEAVCGIEVHRQGGTLSVRPDRSDPFSLGHICPKATAIPDIMADADRVVRPRRRDGSSWHDVSWSAALDEAAERLAGIMRRDGPNAVAVYFGNPTVHSYSALMATSVFLQGVGSRARFSATSVDQLPHMLAAQQMLGHQLLLPIPDIDRSMFVLMLGANPAASNGSIMTAPNIVQRLKALQARGGRWVVVDPRRTESAALADTHHFIRPGRDAYLLLAMLHTLFAEGLIAKGCSSPRYQGLAALAEMAAPFSPARVAQCTGLTADAIVHLARDFAQAPAAVCYGRVGACTQEFGGTVAWLINALNAVTGNLDRPGGAMFPQPAVDVRGLIGPGHFNRWQTRVRQLPEFAGELPVAVLAEEIDTPGAGQIRGLITFAGNPVLSTPHGARLDRALQNLEFMVSIDLYQNETTRHANIILPTSFGLERDHYDMLFYNLSVRNAARYVPAVCAPPVGVRHDWQVLTDLLRALWRRGGGRPHWRTRLQCWMLRAAKPHRLLDMLLRRGPYRGMSLSRLRRAPHGLDLGPLQPALGSRSVQLAPTLFTQELARLKQAMSLPSHRDTPADTLMLIGRRELRSNNSWMHNALRLVKGPVRCTLLMHPTDADHRALQEGAEVTVTSRVGSVHVPLHITPDIAPGVVSLPHGYGHGRAGTRLTVAAAHGGVSINDLTDDTRVDLLSGNAAFSGTPVTVTAAAQTLATARAPASI